MTVHLVEIFRPGSRKTSAGETISFSESDCRLAAAAYSPKRRTAPLVLGHPPSDGPGLGDTLRLTVINGALHALVQPVDALVRLVRQGAYKKISAAFLRPADTGNPVPGSWYLRHIGFLGSAPPAIKGMASPQFCQGPETDFSFTEDVPLVEFSEPPGYEVGSECLAMHRAALTLQRGCNALSYTAAVRLVESTQCPGALPR